MTPAPVPPPPFTVAALVSAVAEIAPHRLAEEWDRVGLQVGDPAATVRRVMTCLELTPATLDEARHRQAGAIVAHHPLLFRPLAAVDLSQPVPRLVAGLLAAGIALVAAHTNLDAAAWGTNQALAEALGLTPDSPLLPRDDDPALGLGCLVRLDPPLPAEDFAAFVRQALALPSVRLSGDPRRSVRRVAILTGSGGSFVARAAGRADCLLTGEITYHHAVEAHQRGLPVIELGHFESEVIVAAPLAERLARYPRLAASAVACFPARDDLQPFRLVGADTPTALPR